MDPRTIANIWQSKNKLTDGTLRLAIPNSEKLFVFYVMPLTIDLALNSCKKINLEKRNSSQQIFFYFQALNSDSQPLFENAPH